MAKQPVKIPIVPVRATAKRRWREDQLQTALLAFALLVVALVAGLAGYGVLDEYVLVPRRAVANVGQSSINMLSFEKSVRYKRWQVVNEFQAYAQILQMLGNQPQYAERLKQLELNLNDAPGLGRQVLASMVDDELVMNEAAQRGLIASEAEIDVEMRNMFGYDPNAAPPTPMPAPTSDPAVTPTAGPSPSPQPSPTPYTAEAYQKNLSEFLTNILTQTGLTEADLRVRLQARVLARMVRTALTASVATSEEQAHARHILMALDKKAEAEAVLQRALKGEDFVALAAEFSTDSSNAKTGGDLDWFTRGMMVAPFDKAVFEAKVGLVPALVQTDFGFHIIEVLAREVRPLAAALLEERRDATFNDWLTLQRTAPDVKQLDWWVPRVPTTPALTADAVQ